MKLAAVRRRKILATVFAAALSAGIAPAVLSAAPASAGVTATCPAGQHLVHGACENMHYE
jgi:hypothetical protein